MKSHLTMVVFWLLGAAVAVAQGVSVEVLLDQKYFLPKESLIVKVRVTNYSGQTLRLGQDDDWLTFTIEGRKDNVISKLAPVPVGGEYTLETSRTGTKAVDLAPYFDLSRPGHYRVTANVRIPQWQREIQSNPVGFDIITGSTLWEQEFGVPPVEPSATGRPEIRKYALVQSLHQEQLMLYFRLSDAANNRVERIFMIGQMVSFSRPEPQLDRFSNLHILYQTGARRFIYSIVNPDGVLIARETHEVSDTKPRLRAEDDGRIKVIGGVRRVMSTDIPPQLSSTSATDAGVPQP